MAINFLDSINITGSITTSTTGTFGGDVSVEDNLYLTDSGTTRAKIQLNSSDRDDLDIIAVSLGSNMKFFTVDTERMRITSGGNVGIGMTPRTIGTYKVLDLSGSGSHGAYIGFNNGATGQAEIYSTNSTFEFSAIGNKTIKWYTGGSQKMTLLSSGNVGIGTTSPTAALHVQKSISGGFAGTIYNTQSTGGFGLSVRGGNSSSEDALRVQNLGGTYLLNVKANGNVGIGVANPETSRLLVRGSTNDSSTQLFQAANLAGATRYAIRPDGDNKWYKSDNSLSMILTSSGNVGIGTSAPGQKLSVQGDSTAAAGRFTAGGNTNTLELFGNSTTGQSSGLLVNAGTNTADYAARFRNAAGSVMMNIRGDGNVGIGTITPVGKVEVLKNGGTSDVVVTSDTLALLQLKDSSLTKHYNIEIGRSSSAGDLTFRSVSGEKVRFTEAGNVGIGTHDPAQKLQVEGNAWIKGIYYDTSGDAGGSGQVLSSTATGTNWVSGSGLPGGPYLPLAGGTMTGNLKLNDNVNLYLGTGNDFQAYHDGSNTYLRNLNGNFIIKQDKVDADLILESDNGSGGTTPYLTLDGSEQSIVVTASLGMFFNDGVAARFGDIGDLLIYHDGDNSFIQDTGAGDLYIDAAANFFVRDQANGEVWMQGNTGGVNLRYQNAIKIETTNTGVTVTGAATATTFIGDLNGTINTATTAVTQANATDNTTVATTAFVQNLIGTIPAGLVFQGTWNAATNTPTLTSGSGTTGHFYIVSTSGSTNLDGVTDWVTGDWAVFIEQGGTDAWEKIDNSSVLDGAGTGQKVALWSGSGTSNTLTDAPITVSGNNATFAGNVTISNASPALNLTDTDNASNIAFSSVGGALIVNSASDQVYQTGGTERMRIKSNGNVGIDKSSPDGKLHVHQTGSGTLNTIITEDDARKIFIGRDAINCKDLSNNNAILFLNQSGGNVSVPNSSLGIGTTSPTNKLTIASSTGGGTAPDSRTLLYLNKDGQAYISINSPAESFNGIRLNIAGAGKAFMELYDNTSQGKKLNIGTIDARDLVFATTNAEKMRILANGNVGIGTTAPGTKLFVAGNVSISAGKAFRMYNAANNGWGEMSFVEADDRIQFNRGIQNSGVDWKFPDSGNSYVNANEGNFGIGTTSPGERLQVNSGNVKIEAGATSSVRGLIIAHTGQTGNQTLLVQNSSGTPRGHLYTTERALRIEAGADGGTGTGETLDFWVNGSERMMIDTTGNVGIGTTSPGAKLQVGSRGTAGALTPPVTDGILFDFHNDGSPYTRHAAIISQAGDASESVIDFWTKVASGTSAKKMTILGSGNVGIGTTAPGTTLQVGGLDDGSNYDITLGWNAVDSQAVGTKRSALTFKTAQTSVNNGDIYKWDIAMLAAPATVTGEEFGSDLAFLRSTRDSTAVDATTMILTRTGNVGIGTTNPVATYDRTLHVKGVNPTIRIETDHNSGWAYNQYASPQSVWSVGINAPDQFHITNSASLGSNVRLCIDDATGNLGIGTIAPQSKLQVAGGIQMADDTATPSADKVGTLRYYDDANNSYVDMCMKTGSTTYAWINIVQNNF